MITNVAFPPDKPIEDQCGGCTKCIDICPTGALIQGTVRFEEVHCVLTQTKGFLPEEYRDKIGNRIYGCDTCQTVCPKTKEWIFIIILRWSRILS